MHVRRQFFGLFLFIAFVGAIVYSLPSAYAAKNASLYLSPSSGTFTVGSTFDVSIVLNTVSDAVNLIEAELLFPRDKIQIANPSVGKSLVEVWATPPTFSNQEGRVYFVGGIPSPGITTSNGIVLTITFRVISSGEAEIRFGNSTRVLANDGVGTDVLAQATPSSFTFRPIPPQGPEISSPTHPDQARYYKQSSPSFIWTRDGATAFSYLINKDLNSLPNTIIDTTETSVSFNDLEDGIWYSHVRAQKNGIWGGGSSFMIRIDTLPPAVFDLTLSSGRRTTEERPIVRFFTTDSLSGLDHYELKIIPLDKNARADTAFFFEVASPYQFTPLQPGRYVVLVRAYDKAGNWRDAEKTITITRTLFPFANTEGVDFMLFFVPWTILLNVLFFLVLLLLLGLGGFWHIHKNHIHMSIKEDIKLLFHIFSKHDTPPKPL